MPRKYTEAEERQFFENEQAEEQALHSDAVRRAMIVFMRAVVDGAAAALHVLDPEPEQDTRTRAARARAGAARARAYDPSTEPIWFPCHHCGHSKSAHAVDGHCCGPDSCACSRFEDGLPGGWVPQPCSRCKHPIMNHLAPGAQCKKEGCDCEGYQTGGP